MGPRRELPCRQTCLDYRSLDLLCSSDSTETPKDAMTRLDFAELDLPAPVQGGGFRVDPKVWDSAFFECPTGSLTWSDEATRPDAAPTSEETVGEVCRLADEAGYALTECHVDVADLAVIARLEWAGFRLVDSRIRFLTRTDLRDVEPVEPKWGTIRTARPEDRDRMVELTHEGFTYNDRFISRFKNPEYYSEAQTRRYFEAWIDSTAFSSDAATAVFEAGGGVAGYFIYQVRGEYEGVPLVKGILTAVTSDQRGADAHVAMQAFLYGQFGLPECYIENVTQLTNAPVIRNHVRSAKRYESTALTFYRRST